MASDNRDAIFEIDHGKVAGRLYRAGRSDSQKAGDFVADSVTSEEQQALFDALGVS